MAGPPCRLGPPGDLLVGQHLIHRRPPEVAMAEIRTSYVAIAGLVELQHDLIAIIHEPLLLDNRAAPVQNILADQKTLTPGVDKPARNPSQFSTYAAAYPQAYRMRRLFAQTRVPANKSGCRRRDACCIHGRIIADAAAQYYRCLRAGWVAVWTSFSLRMDTTQLAGYSGRLPA